MLAMDFGGVVLPTMAGIAAQSLAWRLPAYRRLMAASRFRRNVPMGTVVSRALAQYLAPMAS